jgi:hypothetical protein
LEVEGIASRHIASAAASRKARSSASGCQTVDIGVTDFLLRRRRLPRFFRLRAVSCA